MSKHQSRAEEAWQEFYGPNLGYMWEQYDVYKEDPDAVEPEIKSWFDQYGPPSSNG